jgi:hypothetical protein
MRSKMDTILWGVLLSALSIYLLNLFFQNVILPLAISNGKQHFLFPPKMELYILVIMIVLFRIFLINYKLYNFGRGWLLSVFTAAMLYFYLSKEQLPI